MSGEVETADWSALFRELPKAIEQLESHDAHHSLEAAMCLRMALSVLRARGGTEDVYQRLIIGMYRLSEIASNKRREELSDPTVDFLDEFHAFFHAWDYDYNADEWVIERLTGAWAQPVSAEAA